ncbi:MAG TPA: disulfide bond formation protein DsbA, partial [Balneolaceae bacterium]|nr:disulfide bond formation protein DsbA [Balneolaceae bacterium]
TYSEQVMADIEEAHRIGVQGVPFFYINNKYGLSGAQPVDVFVDTLQQIEAEAKQAAS